MRDIDIIRKFEGCVLSAYRDAVGVLTIGYGHTGPDVVAGMRITQAEADALLDADLGKFRQCVAAGVTEPITDAMRAALVSFAFNVGCGAFAKSTLLKRVNAKDWPAAANEFLRWNKAGGRVLAGLTNRRRAERALFLSQLPDDAPLWLDQEDKPMLPFIAAALPALINAAPDLIRVFGGGEQSEKNAKAAEKVVEIAKVVTGEATAEGAVNKIQTDPAAADAFAAEARAQFLEIEALMDKRVDAAREFNANEPAVIGKFKFVHLLSTLVVVAALGAIGYVLGNSEDPTERSMALQTLLLTGFGGVLMYWLGSSDGSAKKTELMRRDV